MHTSPCDFLGLVQVIGSSESEEEPVNEVS